MLAPGRARRYTENMKQVPVYREAVEVSALPGLFIRPLESSLLEKAQARRQEQAELLAKKLQGMAAHVNMIPLNSVEESGLRCSSRQAIAKFQEILERHGVTATVRRTLGSDINASCGQLRRKYELKQ